MTQAITMDPREARFLASQAERLSSSRRQQANNNDAASSFARNRNRAGGGDDAPGSVDGIGDADADDADDIGSKEKKDQFWRSFRSLCSEFRRRIDSLLLIPCSSDALIAGDDDVSNNGEDAIAKAKAFYATAARRNEGRIDLNSVLQNVRSLQRHVMSSSSSLPSPASGSHARDEADDRDGLLRSILATPMPEVAQTDERLISQEMNKILKRIDRAREVICPKEKFVFKRYRRAVEERERMGESAPSESTVAENERDRSDAEREKVETERLRGDNLRSKYGGVLENMSNCTVEINSDGTVLINDTTEDRLRHYGRERSVDALHPTESNNGSRRRQPDAARESSSYLLQHLDNVTVLIHGARPSLHLQHVSNCRVYVSEPTAGPVHVTKCRSSEVRCSCHQLRVHDSKDVEFSVWTRSGPIIEDCVGMVFGGGYYCSDEEATEQIGRNMFWDVKDFNWLRALRKSPNFVVVAEPAADKSSESEAPLDDENDNLKKIKTVDALEEEDSEDEL